MAKIEDDAGYFIEDDADSFMDLDELQKYIESNLCYPYHDLSPKGPEQSYRDMWESSLGTYYGPEPEQLEQKEIDLLRLIDGIVTSSLADMEGLGKKADISYTYNSLLKKLKVGDRSAVDIIRDINDGGTYYE